MTLLVGSRRIADGGVQSVALRRAVGAYELVFAFYLTASPGEGGLPRGSVLGARVSAKPSRGEPRDLGIARPERPFEVVCREHVTTATPTLHICLQPGQIAALETLREAGDLTFDLSFSGTASDRQGEQQVYGSCSVGVPRSEWLEKLRGAGVRDTLLVEVPLPLEGVSEEWREAASHLRHAEEHYRNGDYRGCIASCRIAIDAVGELRGMNWSKIPDLARGMDKAAREEALFAVVRHYTHEAHHAASDGGARGYTRREAELILNLTAAATAHALSG